MFLASQKLSFWDPFSITFSVPFLDPPLDELLALLGPPRCRSSLAMSILEFCLDPPGVQNGALERPRAAKGGQKGWSFELGSRSRLRLGPALWSKGVPRAILIAFGTPWVT